MHRSLLTSLVLAVCALVVSTAASALPIKVGLTGAVGNHVWTSPAFGDPSQVTLSAWQWNTQTQSWDKAYMTNDTDANHNSGLGVCAVGPANASSSSYVCTESGETNEIDSIPEQMIEMDLSQLEDWSSVTVTLLSVDNYAYLAGANCSLTTAGCNPDPEETFYLGLDEPECTQPDPNSLIAVCTFSKSFLTQNGISAIRIEPQSDSNDNSGILLGSGLDHGFIMEETTVPEPPALWIFGFGLLLVSLFFGLGRRRRTH